MKHAARGSVRVLDDTGFNPEIPIWEVFGVVRGDSGRFGAIIWVRFWPHYGHLGPHLGHLGPNSVQNTPRTS